MDFYVLLQVGSLHLPKSHVVITKLLLSHPVHHMHIIPQASDLHGITADL